MSVHLRQYGDHRLSIWYFIHQTWNIVFKRKNIVEIDIHKKIVLVYFPLVWVFTNILRLTQYCASAHD